MINMLSINILVNINNLLHILYEKGYSHFKNNFNKYNIDYFFSFKCDWNFLLELDLKEMRLGNKFFNSIVLVIWRVLDLHII